MRQKAQLTVNLFMPPMDRRSGTEMAKPPRVLVADDNSDMRQYITRLLGEYFRVEAVSDGEEALSAARRHIPDLLLIDVMMPRLDGFGVLRAVRADSTLRGVPVIMLSARAGEESRVEGLDAGADDYLVKPFSARELLARVTAHLQMAQLRREAEAMLRRQASLLDQTHDSIFVWDFPGRIIYWNRAAEQLYGFSQEEAIGKVSHDLLATVFPQENRASFELVLEQQGEFKGELIHTKKSGESITVDSRIRLLTEANAAGGWCLRPAGTFPTGRWPKRNNAPTTGGTIGGRSPQGRVPGNVGSRASQPAAPIGNALRIVRLSTDPQAKDRALSLMERQLGQLVRLVEDLMDVNRINRGKLDLRKERVSLTTVVSSAVETSSPLIERMSHELTVSLPREPIIVDADLTRLAQVFMNLLNNAAKYTERGGKIRLTASRQGGEVVVSLRDTGIGIPPERLQSIFGMFSQVEHSLGKAQGGLGIGLTLVKRLVEMHGGAVEARSQGRGTGSEFIVRLPLAVSPAAEQSGGTGEATTTSNSQRRILVADDNRDSADSLAMLLDSMGYDTRTAYDGLKALELGATFEPDIVLLDIGMPKLNGYETCRRIREQAWGKNAVLIACTGLGLEEDKRRSQEAGFNLHMVKPVDPVVLMKLLTTLKVASV